MLPDSSSTPSTDSIQLPVSKSVLNEKKQLSFVYQPGVGLYDKKKTILEHDQRRLSTEKLEENIPTNQENQQKRKADQHVFSPKKSRPSTDLKQISNSKCHSPDRSQKHCTTPIIKGISMVKKLSSDNRKSQADTTEQEEQSIPSRGLLLCPKDEPTKKKKKKKISIASTALLDDDSVVDSILFNEIQSVQQQWQQFLIYTMEKELHITPSDGKKKLKGNRFHRTNEFLLAYEDLYNFEGMKHWCPLSR